MNLGRYPDEARLQQGGRFSLQAFQDVTRAVERHDLLNQWHHDGLLTMSPFYGSPDGPVSFLVEPPIQSCRIVVGDIYIDEPVAQFPSERLIATIALLLQARGEL